MAFWSPEGRGGGDEAAETVASGGVRGVAHDSADAATGWLRDGRIATRGHGDVIATVAAWGRDGMPHAVLLVGPASVGKATLARDVAAALLCIEPTGEAVPCGRCSACARVASGNHPDLHLLRPVRPGDQIRIGDRDAPDPGTVRSLIRDLALSSAEGGSRVAIVESAHRMNEDAQNALLRALEEPPPGVVILLCADDEDRLLPTVRSRCVRLRLGPVSTRAIEGLLGELGLADPPTAARLARLAEGRPGIAIALARRPDAVRAREEIARRLLDLASEGAAARLVAAPSLLAAARQSAVVGFVAGTDDGAETAAGRGAGRTSAGRGRTRTGRSASPPTSMPAPVETSPATAEGTFAEGEDAAGAGVDTGPAGRRRAPASERREAARGLIDAWRPVARDLAVASVGGSRELRDATLLEEMREVAGRLPAGAAAAFLARLAETERLIESNAGPELAVDTLLLAWPEAAAAALGSARGWDRPAGGAETRDRSDASAALP